MQSARAADKPRGQQVGERQARLLRARRDALQYVGLPRRAPRAPRQPRRRGIQHQRHWLRAFFLRACALVHVVNLTH